MSVLQRFREIGILRAIGVTRSQAWRMVLVESATMGLTAFVLSIPLGWLLTTLITRGAGEGFGSQLETIYPYVWIPFVLVFGVVDRGRRGDRTRTSRRTPARRERAAVRVDAVGRR